MSRHKIEIVEAKGNTVKLTITLDRITLKVNSEFIEAFHISELKNFLNKISKQVTVTKSFRGIIDIKDIFIVSKLYSSNKNSYISLKYNYITNELSMSEPIENKYSNPDNSFYSRQSIY